MLNGHFKNFFLINQKNKVLVYSLNRNESIAQIDKNEIKFYYCHLNYCILQQSITLSLFSIDTSEYIWEKDLDNKNQIRTIIGVQNNQLIVFLSERQLISINTENGETLWEIPDFLLQFPKDEFAGLHWYWHLEDGYLYILKHRHYIMVNIDTLKVELLWENTDKTYSITHCTYTDDMVCFTACNEPEIQPSLLGVFNRKTLNIDWLYESDIFQRDKYGSFNQAPQTDGEKLYFLDSTGVLHIFEKEEKE
jgi:hypothetical protein